MCKLTTSNLSPLVHSPRTCMPTTSTMVCPAPPVHPHVHHHWDVHLGCALSPHHCCRSNSTR
jgi:hypothetical protein